MPTGSILIVDDDENVRNLAIRYLESQGYRTWDAADGKEAIQHIERGEFDLMITDYRMPGMNGLELAKKALRWDPDRPVILMTAFAEVDNARESVKIGVYDFISKPFDLVDFGNSVSRAIKHRRVVMENRAYQHNLEKMVAKRTQELRETMKGLDRKVKELKARDRINQHLLTVHTIDETTSAIAEAVQAALDVERLALFLSEGLEGKLELATGGPDNENMNFESWMEEARSAVKRAFLSGEIVSERDGQGFLCAAVPMVRLGETVGVIYLEQTLGNKPLSEEDLQALSSLAAQAAVALMDANLYCDSEKWGSVMTELEGFA